MKYTQILALKVKCNCIQYQISAGLFTFIFLNCNHIIYLLTNIVKQNGRNKSLNPLEAPGISSTGARLRRLSRNFFDRNPLMNWNWGQLLLDKENTFRASTRLCKDLRSTVCVWKMQELEQIQMTTIPTKTWEMPTSVSPKHRVELKLQMTPKEKISS